MKKHMGFNKAAAQAAKKAGVSMERGRAIIAAGSQSLCEGQESESAALQGGRCRQT